MKDWYSKSTITQITLHSHVKVQTTCGTLISAVPSSTLEGTIEYTETIGHRNVKGKRYVTQN